MSTGKFRFRKGERVVTRNNGTPGVVRKNKVNKKGKRVCLVHFDADRYYKKTWEMDEDTLTLEPRDD